MAERLFQSLTDHPCHGLFRYQANQKGTLEALSHRSGGFGGTCARCGTPIEGPNNTPTGPLSWTPVAAPKPFQPGSVERMIYDTLCESNAPIHVGWCESLAEQIADKLKEADV